MTACTKTHTLHYISNDVLQTYLVWCYNELQVISTDNVTLQSRSCLLISNIRHEWQVRSKPTQQTLFFIAHETNSFCSKTQFNHVTSAQKITHNYFDSQFPPLPIWREVNLKVMHNATEKATMM